jgi:hypothetical protein
MEESMSGMFRPVVEKWGQSYDNFIDHDDLVSFLAGIASQSNGGKFLSASEHEYDDVTVVTVHEGQAFIDFVKNNLNMQAARDIVDDFGGVITQDDEENFAALIQNMKVAAEDEWPEMLDGGALRFYVD